MSILNAAANVFLTIGGKIHPLMGHLYEVLPGAQIDAKHAEQNLCTMCATAGLHGKQETQIETSGHAPSGVCIHHDLMLHNAQSDGYPRVVADHANEIYTGIVAGTERPGWMPHVLYSMLTDRAHSTAHRLARANVADLLSPIIERRIIEQTLKAERLEAQLTEQRARNIIDQANGK